MGIAISSPSRYTKAIKREFFLWNINMSEEENTFDPTKKKKKKKKPFEIDAELAGESNGNNSGNQQSENGTTNGVTENNDAADENSFDPSLKKKKKKKPFDLDSAVGKEQNGKESDEKKSIDELTAQESRNDEAVNDADDLESFGKKKNETFNMNAMKDAIDEKVDSVKEDDLDLESFGERKKKKKKRGILTDLDSETKSVEQEDENANAWDQSDRDYTYDELLQRVFGIMKQKNPEMVSGEKKKFVMRPPQVVRAGTKKTAFVNFTDMANNLRRQPKHLLSFISAELGTVGAVDGSNQLILKGRFQQKHLENVMRRYIKEYVTCHTCKSPTTILEKEDRIYFLKCETCQSKYSVQAIKAGFQAVTGKRAAMRAKE